MLGIMMSNYHEKLLNISLTAVWIDAIFGDFFLEFTKGL